MTAAFLINPLLRKITRVHGEFTNATVYALIGDRRFDNVRIFGNQVVHHAADFGDEEPYVGFVVKGVPKFLRGKGLITGPRPFKDQPFGSVNCDIYSLLWKIMFADIDRTNSAVLHLEAPKILCLE